MSMKMCVASDKISCWEDIDFKSAEKFVKKLQKRIALAYRQDGICKLTTLRHMLIHSFYAKALAVRIVSANRGRYTPGVDNVIWETPEDRFYAISELRCRGYRPKPLRRIYIPKSDGSERPLDIPTMKDRAMQTLCKMALEPIAEMTADDGSFGFRQNRNARGAIVRCVEILSECSDCGWILKADIKGCFNNISHDWLVSHIPMDEQILMKFLKSGYIYDSVYYPTEKGLPQGGCISSVICNMTLDGLEGVLAQNFEDKAQMIRYADDIIIISDDEVRLRQNVVPTVVQFLGERGLSLSKEKTNVFNVKDGVEFLGWKIFKENNTVISVPSEKSIDRLLNKIVDIYTKNSNIEFNKLVELLEAPVRGWLNYYIRIAEPHSLLAVISQITQILNKLSGTTLLQEHLFKKIRWKEGSLWDVIHLF